MFDSKRLFTISREFLRALSKKYTYDIRENGYVLFGILWGIPVPIVSIGLGLYFSGISPTINSIIQEVIKHPIQIIFLIHPLIFAIVFGAMGTVRDDLDHIKDNFLSMVSHELKTPLTTVQGYVTFVRKSASDTLSKKELEALEIVEEQADNLNNLIGELVDLSRIELGEFEVTLKVVDLSDVTGKIIKSFYKISQDKQVKLENRLPGRLEPVLADVRRIEQVFTNLIGNAIKFTAPGGVITISSIEKEKEIEFSVSDTGIGISNDDLDKIFDKFYQSDSTGSREYEGCGLGLAISNNIVKLHKCGSIQVESEPGKGSRFSFVLNRCT